MPEFLTNRDQALEQLSAEFPSISARVVVAVFLGYLERTETLSAAVAATRERIQDACTV